MITFKKYINEVKMKTRDIIEYEGFSNSMNIPGVGGTHLFLKIGDFSFGLRIMASYDFRASIVPNISSDWRKVSPENMDYFRKYFSNAKYKSKDPLFSQMAADGLDLEFDDAKELVKFLKKIKGYDEIVKDLLYKTKEKIPTELKDALMKGIKLSIFEKKLLKADDFDKIQLMIKKYKPEIPEKGSIYFYDGSEMIGYAKINKYYFYLDGRIDDEKLSMIVGRNGEIHSELRNRIGSLKDIQKRIEDSNILPIKYKKTFFSWLENQER